MQKLCLMFVAMAFLFCGGFAAAAEVNQIVTYSESNTATNKIVPPNASDAEIQAHAKTVLYRVMIFGIVALVGALLLAGVAVYKAYKKFGVIGAVGVGLLLAIGVVMFCSFLLSF